MSLPATLLPALGLREAITDALYRGVLGFDTADATLFDSAFTPDASFDINGDIMQGLDTIHAKCYDPISKLDTTHFVTNVRVHVLDGGAKASMTASALSQHFLPDQGMVPAAARLLAGGLYNLDLIKDETDGLWKITHWKLKSTWAEGDWAVFTGK